MFQGAGPHTPSLQYLPEKIWPIRDYAVHPPVNECMHVIAHIDGPNMHPVASAMNCPDARLGQQLDLQPGHIMGDGDLKHTRASWTVGANASYGHRGHA